MSGPVLVVSPVFHGYWEALESALAHLGDDVVVHRYDAATGLAHVRDALGHRLPGGRLRRSSMRAETDRAIAALRTTNAPGLAKGLSGDTLDGVAALLADGAARSATEVAAALGLSRVTARRYLEHLAASGDVERSPRYGAKGRPELEYSRPA